MIGRRVETDSDRRIMEGVGARLGRSSTRYGPATVFNGPVRKWKKKWVHVAPSSAASNTTTNHSHQIHNQNNRSNGTTNGINGSHLLLYKWTPITQSNNGNNSNGDRNSGKDEAAAALEEPPRRKFKYIPVLLPQLVIFFLGSSFFLFGFQYLNLVMWLFTGIFI